jgi:hypothetical protein
MEFRNQEVVEYLQALCGSSQNFKPASKEDSQFESQADIKDALDEFREKELRGEVVAYFEYHFDRTANSLSDRNCWLSKLSTQMTQSLVGKSFAGLASRKKVLSLISLKEGQSNGHDSTPISQCTVLCWQIRGRRRRGSSPYFPFLFFPAKTRACSGGYS